MLVGSMERTRTVREVVGERLLLAGTGAESTRMAVRLSRDAAVHAADHQQPDLRLQSRERLEEHVVHEIFRLARAAQKSLSNRQHLPRKPIVQCPQRFAIATRLP